MRRRYWSWSKRFLRWFFRHLQRCSNKLNTIFQFVYGSRNQTIGVMQDRSVAIANVEKLIQHFHSSPQEVLSLQGFWENWSQETKPPLSPDLVIGGRDQTRDHILNWLRDSPSPFTLQADSPEEAIAFLGAVFQNLEDEERTNAFPRAVVVNSATSWQSLIRSPEPLILIARLEQPEGVGYATQQGHHVFVPSERVSSDSENLLPRIVRDAAEQAFREMGLSYDKSRSLATLARRSLSALRRSLAITKSTQQPAWAAPTEARGLLAPLLVSAWDGSNEGDREVLAQLSGLSYEALQSQLVRWANEPDPPLRRVGNIWMIVAQEDAWRLIARYLTDDDFKRFENVALNVLSELDPRFELPPEQRFAAATRGKVLTRSKYLRDGLSEMLALMATLSSEISFNANRTGENVARRIVCQLMENAKTSELLWASLAHQLPLLAEAAPEILLDAIDDGLVGENPILVSLFQDKTSTAAFMSSSPHTGMLWALETLAWNPAYLSRAALNLACLTRLDTSGYLVNRPVQSLREVFICWHPQTTASLKSRLNVLDTIRKREPDVAWQLLMNLLPTQHSTASPTHAPKWRDWKPDSQPKIMGQEYLEATTKILTWLISDAKSDGTRWCSLVLAASGMKADQKEILLHALETLDPQTLALEEQVRFSDCLRKETMRHREYSHTEWALTTVYVQRLEAVLAKFEPEVPALRYRWLFKRNVELPENRETSWQERDRIVEDLRTKALQEILNLQGWDGVMQLAQQAKEPSFIGITLARAELLPIDLGQFLRENLWSNEQWRCAISKSYVSFNASNQGENWIEDCLNANLHTWSAEEHGEFLICLPFNISLLSWLAAADLETERYFWSHVSRIDFLEAAYANQILRKLLEFGRPHLAAAQMYWDLEKSNLFSHNQIAEVLEVCIQTKFASNFDVDSFAYASAKLMSYLEKSDLSQDRLAKLEWAYFRIHNRYRRSHILFGELARNPELFVEALQCIFRAKNEPIIRGSDERDAPSLLVSESAWHLLEEWKQMPGVLEDGSVDAEALRSWVDRVRKLAAECDRSTVADIYIGHSFAFSPSDLDGAWPHKAVRDLIEDLANSVIERGWRTQIFNNRGITSRSLTDGGEQERTLVEKYIGYVKHLRDQWPRTAAVLSEMARDYHQQASGEDVEAELTQDFW